MMGIDLKAFDRGMDSLARMADALEALVVVAGAIHETIEQQRSNKETK